MYRIANRFALFIQMDRLRQFILSKKSFFEKTKFHKGGPILVLCVTGSVVLMQFSDIKYKYFGNPKVSAEDYEKFGMKVKPTSELTLEAQFDKIKGLDIENWKQIRGPRPWEQEGENIANHR